MNNMPVAFPPLSACWRAILVVSIALQLQSVAIASAEAKAEPIPRTLTASRLQDDEELPLDGTLDHPAWRRTSAFNETFQIQPTREPSTAYRTSIRVLFNSKALFVGIDAYDPHPADIRSWLVRHDRVDSAHDAVTVYVDPIGSRRSAQWFRVSASGSTADGLYVADHDEEDPAPDYIFDAAVVRNATGFTAVLRIPFSSLRFTEDGGNQWRLMVARQVPRQQAFLTLSTLLPEDATSFIATMPPLSGLTPPRDASFFSVHPTVTWRGRRERVSQSMETQNRFEPSLDLKWRPRTELVLDLTLNPDFSQVELDLPQLSGNTRFALFVPEKRPFFLESSDLLVTPTTSLYTRSISDPDWGLRTSWRGEQLAGIGLITRDKGGGLVPLPNRYGTDYVAQPASDLLLGRLLVDSDGWSAGFNIAHRKYRSEREENLGENSVLGFDGHWRPTSGWSLKTQVLSSSTTARTDSSGSLASLSKVNGGAAHVRLKRLVDLSLTEVSVDELQDGFRNDSGFVEQVGVRRLHLKHEQGFRGPLPFNQTSLYLDATRTSERESNRTISDVAFPGFWLSAPYGTEISVEPIFDHRQRTTSDGILHKQSYLRLWGKSSPSLTVSKIEASLDVGRLLDVGADAVRRGIRGSFEAHAKLFSRLELIPQVQWLQLRNSGEQQYRERAGLITSVWHLTAHQSVRLVFTEEALERRADAQLGLPHEAHNKRATSLVYALRSSASTAWYVGATREQESIGLGKRATEVFVKLRVNTSP